MNLEQHSLSAAFPAMQLSEYESLLESIAAIGLQNPIVLFEGKVIDGWHRYCACMDSGTSIKTIELSSSADPQSFVIAQNKERRHLTSSQLATAAIKVYEWLKDGVNSGLQTASVPSTEAKSSKEIAAIAGVSESYINKAKAIETKATDEVKAKVASGEMSLKKAEQTLKPSLKNASPADDYAPSFEELEEAEAYRQAREVLIDTITDADTAFADVSAKLVQVEAMNRVLESRNNGLMNENAALSKIIKLRDRQLAKLRAGN